MPNITKKRVCPFCQERMHEVLLPTHIQECKTKQRCCKCDAPYDKDFTVTRIDPHQLTCKTCLTQQRGGTP